MRFRILLSVFAVIAVSCGGAGDSAATAGPTETPPATNAATSEAPPSTADGAAPTSEAPTSERPSTEGPAAPAIETVLSDGTAFSLADEANPVYLVFWAEW